MIIMCSMQTLGQTIHEARTVKGMTIQSVRDHTGLTSGYLSRLERDQVDGRPTPATLSLIANCLDIDRHHLEYLAGHIPSRVVDAAIRALLRGITSERLESILDGAA